MNRIRFKLATLNCLFLSFNLDLIWSLEWWLDYMTIEPNMEVEAFDSLVRLPEMFSGDRCLRTRQSAFYLCKRKDCKFIESRFTNKWNIPWNIMNLHIGKSRQREKLKNQNSANGTSCVNTPWAVWVDPIKIQDFKWGYGWKIYVQLIICLTHEFYNAVCLRLLKVYSRIIREARQVFSLWRLCRNFDEN